MRYTFFFLLILFNCQSNFGQVIDSNDLGRPPIEQLIPSSEINGNVKGYKQNHFNYLNDKKKLDKNFELRMKVVDPTEDQTPTKLTAPKALIITPPEVETGIKIRLVTGPSQYDSRIELRYLNPLINWQKQVLINSESIGIIIEKEMLHKVTDSIYQLDISSTLGIQYHLCPGEAYSEQPIVGVGTAFIVDNQTMLTAAHVFERPVENYVVVFGFEMVNKVGDYKAIIQAKDIFFPKTIIYSDNDMDVVGFKVERLLDRPVLKWASSLSISATSSVYMIGHPMGLPMKVALNASMQGNTNPQFFYTSLDAFQGNSGSPVFQLDTHKVVGILVSGEIDYKWNGSCNASTLCRIPYCNGEKAIRIEQIMSVLQQE